MKLKAKINLLLILTIFIFFFSCKFVAFKKEKPIEILSEERLSEAKQEEKELPKKIFKEGDLVEFPNLKAYDPDGDPLTYYFSPPLNASGQWQTKVGDAGTYKITITASDGKTNVSQDVLLIIEPANRPPKIQLTEKEIRVKAGNKLKIEYEVSDPDDDEVNVSFGGWLQSPEMETSAADIGEHEATIIASDGFFEVEEKIKIIVEKKNNKPALVKIKDQKIIEGELFKIVPTAFDPDGDNLEFFFSEPLNSSGQWQTKKGDAGEYLIKITVSDGELNSSTVFKLTVEKLNAAPEIILENRQYVFDENSTVVINLKVRDVDGDDVRLFLYDYLEDARIEFKVLENNTVEFRAKKKATFEDAGEYEVKIVASDGLKEVSEKIKIKINNVNRAPIFVALNKQN